MPKARIENSPPTSQRFLIFFRSICETLHSVKLTVLPREGGVVRCRFYRLKRLGVFNRIERKVKMALFQ